MASEWQKIEEGIRVRVNPKRKHGMKPDLYYVLRFTIDGQRKQEALGWASEGWTLEKVRAMLAELRAAKRTGQGEVTLQEKRVKAAAARKQEVEKDTIATLLEKYKVSLQGKPSLKTDLYYQKYFIPTIGSMQPEELRTAHVNKIRRSVEALGKAPATVKHVLCLLRALIRYGANEGLYDMPNISRLRFEMPQIDNQKTECLTPEQAAALFKALDNDPDQNLASMVRLALATGMRRGALLGLQWDDLNFRTRHITLRGDTAKSGKTTQIPMTAAARAILENIAPMGSPYLFSGKGGGKRSDIRVFLNRIRKAANLPEDFRPMHGLRHTYASWLASSGKVDLYTLQKLMTHNSPTMTQRYAHLADEAIKRAASVIDECLDVAANAEPTRPQGAKVIAFSGKGKMTLDQS